MLSFPTGKYDDQVDAISLVGRAIHRLIKGSEPRHAMIYGHREASALRSMTATSRCICGPWTNREATSLRISLSAMIRAAPRRLAGIAMLET